MTYSADFQRRAADQFDTLPAGSPIQIMIIDYSKLRDAIRAVK